MIVKGIIEGKVTENQYRVRIPTFDKGKSSIWATSNENLNVAGVSTIPNSSVNYANGDIVLIGFDEGRADQPIIIGQLQRDYKTDFQPDMNINNLVVYNESKLSEYTTIGEILPKEIQTLKGSDENIKFRLDLLEARIKNLERRVEQLTI